MRGAPAQHTARVQRAVLQAAGEEGASDVVEADGAEQAERPVPGDGEERQAESSIDPAHEQLTLPNHGEVCNDEGYGNLVVLGHPHSPFNPVRVRAAEGGGKGKVEGHAFEHDDLAKPHHKEVPEQIVTKNECGKA